MLLLSYIFRIFFYLTTLISVMGLSIVDKLYDAQSTENSSLSNDVNSTLCPTWYIPSSNGCTCGSPLGPLIRCHNNKTVLVRIAYCMSFDESSQQTLVGNCPYVSDYSYESHKSSSFIKQSKNESHLNKQLCDWANRTGFMCSRCKEGLGVSVFTYDHKCIQCIGKWRGWILYLFLAIAPTSLFFLLVLTCRIRSTSVHMNAIVCIFQIMTFYMNKYPNTITSGIHNRVGSYLLIGAATVAGVWNLDFLRYVIPPFCISEHHGTLNVLAMEYIVAIYPLILIGVTYVCIEQYDKDFTMWLPLKWFLSKVSWKVDLRSSIIDTFATFLHLSYSKLIFVSFNLLGYIAPYNARGEHVYPNVLYYDAEIPYISKAHLPYFILSITTLLLLVVYPVVLLLLYPTKTFQKCLGQFSGINWHPLHAFADSFNGCYKNGTNGTRDYRYFGAFYLVVRILFYLPSVISEVESAIMLTAIPLIVSLMFGVLRPYKNNFYNGIDALLFSVLELNQIWVLYTAYSFKIPTVVQGGLSSLPFIYLLILIIYKLMYICTPKLLENLTQICCGSIKCRALQGHTNSSHQEGQREIEDDSDTDIPDRIRNPENYQPLNAITEVFTSAASQHSALHGSYGSFA